MPDTNPPVTLDTNRTDVQYQRFESAWLSWHDGEPLPQWQAYLPAIGEWCSIDLILMLLKVDIECRVKAGLPALLGEGYFEHPRLQEDDARLDAGQQVELIHWEYQQRLQNGDRPRRAEYEAAFPRHVEALREMKPLSRCPRCRKIIALEETYQTLLCPHCGGESHLLAAAPPFVAATASPTELDPRGYALMETLGKGGMGEVYRCGDPALGRDLAIKVMKANLHDHREVERRFLREARITGSLQHPGIVPIHNLGRLSDGRLHYTMRLVRGRTFAAILKEEAGKPERWPSLLGIFEKICQAVAYAHSKRVIHRDLKPANVMVGRFGEVQVMDWGLAKLLTADEDTASPVSSDEVVTIIRTESEDTPSDLSRAGSGMGTPGYMSPEQAAGDWQVVDERTDVFALGAILCEMLTGAPPYKGADGNELLRRARRADLADSLTRLEKCGADAALIALCRECLSPERESRPRDAESVAQRVADYETEVQERLRQAEVERVRAEARAREEQTRAEAEQARTREALARVAVERRARRRILALAAAVLITIATAFVLVSHSAEEANRAKNQALQLAERNTRLAQEKSDFADKEKAARQTAEAETRKARTVATFLGGIFEASDPVGLSSHSIIFPRVAGESLSGQKLLERGVKKCEQDLSEQPELLATVLAEIGNAYVNLGEYKKAKPLLEKALLLREQRKDQPQDIAASRHALGSLYHSQGDYEAAEKQYRLALQLREEAQPINPLLIADTLFNLGWLLTEKEEHAEAESCYQRCLDLRTKILGKNNRLTALCQVGLAAVYLDRNENYIQAWSLISQSIKTFQRLEGDRSLARAMGLFQQGILLLHSSTRVPLMNAVLDAREQGVKLLTECLQLIKKSPLGPKHFLVAFVTGTLALEFSRVGEDARAKPCFEECFSVIENSVGLWHPKLDKVAIAYAALLYRQHKKREADHFFERVLQARQDRFGENHPQVANALVGYAMIRDKFDPECERMCLRARRIYQQAQPLKEMTTIRMHESCLNQLGVIALDIHRNPVEAENLLRTTWDMFRHSAAIHPVNLAILQTNLALALIAQTKYAEAEKLLKEARQICEKEGQNAQMGLKGILDASVQMYLRKRSLREVESLSLERRKRWPNDPDQLYIAGRHLLECVFQVGQGKPALTPAEQKERRQYLDQSIAALQEAVKLYRKSGEAKYPWYKFSLNWLANAYFAAGRIADAVSLHEQSLKLHQAELSAEDANTLASRGNLAAAYWAAGRTTEAIPQFEEILKWRQSKLGADHPDTLQTMANLGVNYRETGRLTEALSRLEKTLELGRKRSGGFPAQLAWVHGALAETYDRAGQFAKSESIYRDFLDQARRQFGSDDPRTTGPMAALGLSLLRQHKYTDAEKLLHDCLKIREAKQPDDWATFNARSLLGEALFGQKKYADAEPLLVKGYEGMKQRQDKIPVPYTKVRLTEALERLVRLYDAMGKENKAGEWRKKLEAAKQPKKDANK